jgi:putative endopeptidase
VIRPSKKHWKIERHYVKVGYPDKWRDYSALQVSKKSYVENAVNSGKFDFQHMIGKVNKPVDKTNVNAPQMVNAYYNPNLNEIVFPAAILQPPFFYLNADVR